MKHMTVRTCEEKKNILWFHSKTVCCDRLAILSDSEGTEKHTQKHIRYLYFCCSNQGLPLQKDLTHEGQHLEKTFSASCSSVPLSLLSW